jgi:hypothetical protein
MPSPGLDECAQNPLVLIFLVQKTKSHVVVGVCCAALLLTHN